MNESKKFIMVQSESVANKLIAHGFRLLSNINGTYTFINQAPEKFSFNEFDVKKLHFTNNLHL